MGPAPAVAAVRLAVRRALADLPAGAVVLVACSGGADSVALAVATAHEAPRAGLLAAAVTVDHGLQAGSAARAQQVAALLRTLGLDPVTVETVTVPSTGAGGPEAAARSVRYGALHRVAASVGAAALLVGHTRDDQAETVLLGLARGSGARSLSGMAPEAGLVRRPLLGLDRATTRGACRALGLPVWDDPHNDDPAFTRVRVRRHVLPVMEQALGPGVAAALARTAGLLRDDADALDAWASRAGVAVRGADGTLDVTLLAELPAAVRRRILRACALAAGCPASDLIAAHVAELDRLVVAWTGQGPLMLPGPVAASRRCGRLVLIRTGSS